VEEARRSPDLSIAHGEVALTRVAVLYKKIKFYTHENIGFGKIHLPEQEMHTTSFWIDFDPEIMATLGIDIGVTGEVLRAAANALGRMAPLWVMADRRDVAALSQVRAPHTGRPTIYLYDNVPGGVGFAQKIFEMSADLFAETARLIAECPCRTGCPSCVGPELEVGPHGKAGAVLLLQRATETARLPRESRPALLREGVDADAD
jgi:DEAD/DEAH box helicase domain-containing protein